MEGSTWAAADTATDVEVIFLEKEVTVDICRRRRRAIEIGRSEDDEVIVAMSS